MSQWIMTAVITVLMLSCGPAPEASRSPYPLPDTKEGLCKLGHEFYASRLYDSADVYLAKASAMDASYLAPLTELAEMHYALGMQEAGDKNPRRIAHLKKSLGYFIKLESNGSRESETLERLSELSNILEDTKAFVRYARKNAELYPYERQYMNLGLAYFQAGDYPAVIKTEKEAIEKFKGSTFTGSFYRQLGRAYMKVDRDQTAERTFDTGISAVDGIIAERSKTDHGFRAGEEYQRLVDDKIGMLVSLKSLHQTYHAVDKLRKVEQELKDLGYEK